MQVIKVTLAFKIVMVLVTVGNVNFCHLTKERRRVFGAFGIFLLYREPKYFPCVFQVTSDEFLTCLDADKTIIFCRYII